MNNKKLLIGGAIVLVVLAIFAWIFIRSFIANLPSTAASSFANDQALPTPILVVVPTQVFIPTLTPTGLPETNWKFEGFSKETTTQGGYTYHWGTFLNDSGARIKAMCPAPNSPAPNVGDYYRWDKNINILIPLRDNPEGTMQRFWNPQ